MSAAVHPIMLDLRGRVEHLRLPQSNGVYAVIEAMINSLHAIDELPDPGAGRVKIQLHRRHTPNHVHQPPQPGRVIGVTISDNGIGFTDDNFQSFLTSDSRRKSAQGGKGVGRLTWLRVFDDVTVCSSYEDSQNGTLQNRSFSFSFDGATTLEQSGRPTRGTDVKLRDPVTAYADSINGTIDWYAQKLIEHCMVYFVDASPPHVDLYDDDNTHINLAEYFRNHVAKNATASSFIIKGYAFTQHHLLVKSRKNAVHKTILCANRREVRFRSLTKDIPELSLVGNLEEGGDAFTYYGYVTGDLLDQRVCPDRDDFWLGQVYPRDGGDLGKIEVIDVEDVYADASTSARQFLERWLAPVRDANTRKLRDYVYDEVPQFRYILSKYPEKAAAINASKSKQDTYQSLARIEFEHEQSVSERLTEVLGSIDESKTVEEHDRDLRDLLENISETTRSKLVGYVLYRRAVINILDKHQAMTGKGRFPKESVVHECVFPMKKDSNSVPLLQTNLWLLDERLAFHQFLSSDIPLKELEQIIKTESADRPDLAVFNRPMAFADGAHTYSSIVIVDFKRPSRTGYTDGDDEKDPVAQVGRYISDLLKGDAVRYDGAALKVQRGTPFYAYIIADPSERLEEILTSSRGFMPTPDRAGYFWFNPNNGSYIEVISYAKLIGDAKRRNRAFFELLNLPTG